MGSQRQRRDSSRTSDRFGQVLAAEPGIERTSSDRDLQGSAARFDVVLARAAVHHEFLWQDTRSNNGLEPSRPLSRAIMSLRHAAQAER